MKILLTLMSIFLSINIGLCQEKLGSQWIELPKNELTVEQILKTIFPSYGVKISYNDNLIPFKKKVNFKKRRIKTSTVLNAICKNENLLWTETKNRILLKYFERPVDQFYYTLSGMIREVGTSEPLIGTYIISDDKLKTAVANPYGFYSLTLKGGKHKLKVQFIGHQPILQEIDLKSNTTYNFQLQPLTNELTEVTIESKPEFDLTYQNSLMGTNKLNMDVVGDIPYFLGEVDVFQSSLLLPGITNVGEGTSGINVRGGSADQNLIMLDDALIYNSHHFFGLTSVFNADAISDIEIYKGSYPVNYGGRLSSVMHIRQKDGNNEHFQASGGIGLIASRLLLEGPIKKNSSSYLISGRSTFWDYLIRGAKNPAIRDSRANFKDLNVKLNFDIDEKNKIYFSGYLGQDENKFGLDVLRKWGNRLASFRWNHIHNAKLFSNFTGYLSNYNYRVIENDDLASFVGTSRITDYTLKTNFTYFRNPEHIYTFGGSLTYHRLTPGRRIPGVSSSNNEIDLGNENAIETGLYFANEVKLNEKTTINAGLRLSHFSNIGPADVFAYSNGLPDKLDNLIDTIQYSSGENIKMFVNMHPRITAKYQLNSSSAIKLNYSNSIQYMHRLSNTITPSSSDVWKISGTYLEPSISDQVTGGYYKFFQSQKLEASMEVFYRKSADIIEYKGGADLLFNPAIETELLTGVSRSYGFELFVKKDLGKLTGWLGYTLSKSEIKVDKEAGEERINDGKYFPTDFNRTHDLSLSAIYKLNKKWTLSSNFVYQTGRPFSFPIGKYQFDEFTIPHYEERNSNRLPDYHRLDIALRKETRPTKKNGTVKKNKGYWVFSVYNVYSRRNTQSYIFRQDEENPAQSEVVRLSLLGSLVPSVTYNFKF